MCWNAYSPPGSAELLEQPLEQPSLDGWSGFTRSNPAEPNEKNLKRDNRRLRRRPIAVPEEALDVKSLRRSRSRLFCRGPGILRRCCRGARVPRRAVCFWHRRVGGAVKAGPIGPPGGGALRAPGLCCRQSRWAPGPSCGRSVAALGCAGHSGTSPVRRLNAGRPSCSATGHSFAGVRMVCCGHSQTGSLNYTAAPRGVGATAIVELASWLCPSRLRRPPGTGSGSRRRATRSRPA
jgi:hypothetical protein